MGLLQRASEKNDNTPQIRKEKFHVIKERLHGIKKTINFHPALFKEIVDLFSVEKGALFVRDEEKFSLTSIIGYDETTNNRLRLTVNEYDNYLKDNDLDIFQKYFSIRQYKTIKKILLVPFRNNSQIEGLLLISDFKTETEPEYSEILSYVTELEELWKENPLIRLKGIESQGNNVKESVQNYVQRIKNSDNRIIFLKINLTNFIKLMIGKDNLTTSSSVKNNIIKVLTSFVQKRGKVFQLSNNQVLVIILDKKCNINNTVMQTQINSTFASVFSLEKNKINLNYENLIWKDSSLDNILNHFLPDEPN